MDKNNNLMPNVDMMRDGITRMQKMINETQTFLSEEEIEGSSGDGTVVVIMTAIGYFLDIRFDRRALEDGLGKFKERIKEAFADAFNKIKRTTEGQTMKLLKGMNVPQEFMADFAKDLSGLLESEE